MPNKSKLLKLFEGLDKQLKELGKLIDISSQKEKERTVHYDANNETRKYFTNEKNEMLMKISRIRSLEVNWDQQVVSKLVALRNFAKKKLLSHKVCLPILKPGEYELWRKRMEQYIQMIDYSLWKVIENDNTPPITKVVEGVETIIAPTTAEEKAQRRLDLKARSTLLMGIPNEHQLKFKSIKDSKSLLRAVKKRFGGNAATKKTQRNLLKQQYENFTASSLEMSDQTFDRLQKLISQLEIHGESISQEDVNQKFLRSLSPESNTYTIVWRNKPEIDILSIDDLYNNLKIYEPEGTLCKGGQAPRNQENKNRKNTRRVVPVETTTSKALVSYDGFGYDWSDQGEEGPTNFALLAYSSTSSNSEVFTNSNCSSPCLENVKIIKEQNEQLLKDLKTAKLNDISYKTGLEYVEARILVYKKNESVFEEDIKIVDKCKIGLGYNAIPPPYTGNFMPPKPDLSFSGLEEFVNEPIVSEPTVKKPVVETSDAKGSADKPKVIMKNFGPPLIKD
ncbi:hypothetical protein Tco_0066586 [Tanacetum coccineum]